MGGFDEAVISLYAKGMTTGDIAAHLGEVYGTEVSRELVSKVTDAVLEEMGQWQNRPLDPCYPVILIDAIVLKVRDGSSASLRSVQGLQGREPAGVRGDGDQPRG